MKKGIYVVLDDQELIELSRILTDDDEGEALLFLKNHFKRKVRELLEGG